MINIFGTSGMPIRINDAVIICNNQEPKSVGTVYLFHSRPLARIYKFGEQFGSDFFEAYESIFGYLSCRDCPNLQGKSFTIISKSNPHILFRLESVKEEIIRNVIGNTSSTAIKFTAMRFHNLCR